MSMRWVRLFVPESDFERQLWADPTVIGEAPRGIGREVRLATDAEVGLWARRALAPTPDSETPAHPTDDNRRET